MDPLNPGTAGIVPENAANESQNEDLDDVDEGDPVQRVVDGNSSGDSGDDSLHSSDDEDPDAYTAAPQWSITTSGMRPITFTRTDTLLVPMPGDGAPIDWFNLLIDNILLEDICKMTNKYAFEVFFKRDLTPKSRINKWVDLTVPELRIFIGLVLHMGTVRLNRLQDYWKTDPLFDFKAFRSSMPRDRFLNILRCLHFSPPNETMQNQSIKKISPIVDYFNNKMHQIYYPQRELSIDEAMILWRGRLFFRQYVKGKRHKYGIKLYSLCEHQGLILKFLVYAGSADEIVGGKGHTEKVVMHLLKEKLGKGHAVYMDNFYTSYSLSSRLLANKTYSTGTLRQDRKLVPNEVKTAVLKKGETIARYGNRIMIGKWKDKRSVLYLSSEHENEMIDFINKRNIIKSKPLPIVKYNAFMSGVDRADQMMSYYPSEHKTIRWYKKIFIHILQMLLLNSHALYNMYKPKLTFYEYRLHVIRSLLPPRVQVPLETPAQKRLRQAAHKIMRSEERDERNRLKRKNCRICWKNTNKKVKTTYFCDTCEDKPGLCLGQCFDTFHDNL